MNMTRRFKYASIIAMATMTATAATTWEVATSAALAAAISDSQNGDTILVAPGTYLPISTTDNKSITIRGTGGASVTFIDGGCTDRCADLGSDTGHTNTVLSGLTLRKIEMAAEGGIALEWDALIGDAYTVVTATDLATPRTEWQPVTSALGGVSTTPITRDGTTFHRMVIPVGNDTARFFRLEVRQ